MRHFLSLKDFTETEIREIIEIGLAIKSDLKQDINDDLMKRKTLGMIFEKSSTRTRVSFETGIYQLGGIGLFLSNKDIQLGRGEPMKDTARVISRMVDMVMIRTFEHSKLEEFAKYSQVPVINGLTDSYHPVQLLADYMTMLEHGKGKNSVVAYIGDGNNMTHSWLMLCAKLGMELRVATPKGAFYCIVELPVTNADDFAQWLLEKFELNNKTIMVAPAAGFYSTQGLGLNQVRIAYVLNKEDLIASANILKEALKTYNA